MYSVGEVLRAARGEKQWGQRRLAEASGVPQPNIAAYETGRRVPSLGMLQRLVGACGMQIRFDVEPRFADVDRRITELLALPPPRRLGPKGDRAALTLSRLVSYGARLVLDGHLAARLLGAPVADAVDQVWCAEEDLDALCQAASRAHHDVYAALPSRQFDPTPPVEGDELLVGSVRITIGSPKAPPRWKVPEPDALPPIVCLDGVLDRCDRVLGDRVALERLSVAIDQRGPNAHGLVPVSAPSRRR